MKPIYFNVSGYNLKIQSINVDKRQVSVLLPHTDNTANYHFWQGVLLDQNKQPITRVTDHE